MNWVKSSGVGVVSGMALVTIVLLCAFGYVWLNPEGGDRWDAGYFFTHPAFFIIFAVGFVPGFAWKATRSGKSSN
jgi:hypothetical protein